MWEHKRLLHVKKIRFYSVLFYFYFISFIYAFYTPSDSTLLAISLSLIITTAGSTIICTDFIVAASL